MLASPADHLALPELVETLIQQRLIRRVAVHDDSGGWLATYAIESTNEFFTTRLQPDAPLWSTP